MEGRNKRKTTKVHPKPGILQAIIFQLIEKPLNKKSSLENRKCCDYKVEHFISTNWSLNVLWESNCSVQIGRKKIQHRMEEDFFFFSLLVYHSIFLFFFLLIFFLAQLFFSQPSEQVLRRKPNSAMPSWWLHASKAECSRWKPFPPPLKWLCFYSLMKVTDKILDTCGQGELVSQYTLTLFKFVQFWSC